MKVLTTAAICAAMLLAACGQQQPSTRYTLKGAINGLEGENIILAYTLNDTTQVTDTARIEQGAFEFSGTLELPAVSAGLYVGNFADYVNLKHVGFYLEPADMTVSIDTAAFEKAHFTGSFTQLQQDSVMVQVDAIMAEAQPILDAIEIETDHEKASELRDQMEPYYERAKAVQLAFAKSHPDSYLSPEFLIHAMGSMPYAEIKALYDTFTPEIKQYSLHIPQIEKELAALASVQPGQPAPDFATLNVKGGSLRLSDFKGKYVILDFWASWCVPCRKSNPHMKELYKKYHAKGLEIICVADNDSSLPAWHKAIEQDGIDMFHHVLRGLKRVDNGGRPAFDRTYDISDKYAVHFLPTKYLIDAEGKIVGKLTDDELDAKLEELLGA